MTYSWGSIPHMKNHGVSRYGGLTLSINQDHNHISISHGDLDSPSMVFFKIHGYSMWISWNILPVISIFTGRYTKLLFSYRIQIHAVTGMISSIITIISSFYIWGQYKTKPEDGSIGRYHDMLSNIIF